MIVNWLGDNLKIIPLLVMPKNKDEQVVPASTYCTLAPGYNDVKNEDWVIARQWLADDIKAGKIIEEWTKTPKPEKPEDFPLMYIEAEDARESKTMRVPAEFRDIQRPKVIESVVKNTFQVPVLKKWALEDPRPDVQAALMRQIDAVEKGQITG